MLKIVLTYPSPEDEKRIFEQECNGKSNSTKTSKTKAEKRGTEDLLEMIDYIAASIRVDDKIYDYVSDIISATRKLVTVPITPVLSYGASTRAGLALIRA